MSHQKPAKIALEEYRRSGYNVEPVWGNDYYLTVDLDTIEAISAFDYRLEVLQERMSAVVEGRWHSKSHQGEHVYIKLNKRTSYKDRAALQAFLGSDPLREMLGWFDVNNQQEEDPFVLFRPVVKETNE